MAPALDENGLARLTLREIAREHGPSGLDSPRLLNTLLPDLLPGAPRENRLIVAAAQLGVAGLLTSRMSLGLPVATAIGDIAARLADETALDAEAARWVVTEYAYVLGHGPDPRTAVDPVGAGSPPSGAVPPRPRPESDPAPTAVMTPVPPAPTGNRRGLVIAASIVAVLILGSALVYGLTKSPPKKNHGSPGGTTPPAAPCVVGTWNLSDGFLRVDSSGNATDDDSGTKLTPTSGTEVRVFNRDGTGTISLSGVTLEGDTSDGHHVLFYFNGSSDGTFDWVWDGSTVTYSKVDLPGEVRVDVDGSTVADDSHLNPVYNNGDASLSCDGDSLVQTGTGYERDYTRG